MTLWVGPRCARVSEHRLLRPFTHPTGFSGRIAGALLLRVNARIYRAAVDLLAPGPGERVLEVGFGPGYGIERLVARAARVSGLDPSDVMRATAERRNRAAIQRGTVELRTGSADRMPWPDGQFDAALTLNSILLWEPFAPSVRELARVLRPDGRLVVGMHPLALRGQSPPGHGSEAEVARRLTEALGAAGFDRISPAPPSPNGARGLLMTARRPAPPVPGR